LGGFFVVLHPPVKLPEGIVGGGTLTVKIVDEYYAAVDRMEFRRNPTFPETDDIVYEGSVGGTRTVSFRGAIFGTVQLTGQELMEAFNPGVLALLCGRGDEVTITPAMINLLNTFWDALARHASPAVKTVLEQERARFDGFRRFQNAGFRNWVALLGIQVPTQPRLHISGSQRETSPDRFRLAANDLPCVDLSLWRSLDLKLWERVPNATIERDGVTVVFTDPAPPAEKAFYDVRQ